MSDFQQTITSLNLLHTSLYRMELFMNAQAVKNAKTDVISLISRLEKAERERDELRAIAEEQSKLAGSNAARAQKAESELARRDAAAGEPVGLQCMGDSGKWQDCASREVAESLGFTLFRELYTAAPPAVLSPEKITEIMQGAWNEFCDDTGCYPDDFEYQNEQLFFDAGRWAMLVAERISSMGAQQQKVVELPEIFRS